MTTTGLRYAIAVLGLLGIAACADTSTGDAASAHYTDEYLASSSQQEAAVAPFYGEQYSD